MNMNREELHKEIIYYKKQIAKLAKLEPTDTDVFTWTEYYDLRNTGAGYAAQLKELGCTKESNRRIDAFWDMAFKTNKHLESLLG